MVLVRIDTLAIMIRNLTPAAARISWTLCLCFTVSLTAQSIKNNFPDKRAFVVNVCPALEINDFTFGNRQGYQRGDRFEQALTWKNMGDKPIVAFEVVVLKYDPFNRRLVGARWTVDGQTVWTGHHLRPDRKVRMAPLSMAPRMYSPKLLTSELFASRTEPSGQ